MTNEKCPMRNGKSLLTLRRRVSLARAHLRLLRRALHFNSDSAKLTVARLVNWIVTQTVLRADLGRYTRKRRARIQQTRGQEIPATARLRQRVHFAAREIVEVAANLHSFELTHLAEIDVVFRARAWKENLPVALQLFRGKREPPVVLTVLQQTIFNEVFGVDLDKVTRNLCTVELRPNSLKIRIAG